MKILYIDCFSGISGDMTIGALVDAGASPEHLEAELSKLSIADEYELTWKKVIKNGITSTKFDVILKEEKHTSDHSHQDNSGEHHHHHEHDHDHTHHHHHEHDHDHTHHHNHDHHHHSHHHRSYSDIVKMIKDANLSAPATEMALTIFKKIGEAEGRIHGVPLEEVHFHEVGAVDSIIDIVGTAIVIDELKIDRIIASAVPVGSGSIQIDHGIYPVPAPATLEILRGVPIRQSNIKGELTTPTGAAIIAVLHDEFSTFPAMQVTSVGYGAGTKSFKEHPNVLRVVIGKTYS